MRKRKFILLAGLRMVRRRIGLSANLSSDVIWNFGTRVAGVAAVEVARVLRVRGRPRLFFFSPPRWKWP